jgi:hypothetical protein
MLSLVLSTRMLQLSCSLHLTKNLLASHQESLALSTRLLLLLLLFLLASHQEPLGLSPRFLQLLCSWHLTKNLLASHQDFLNFFLLLASHQDFLNFFLLLESHQEPLGLSPRVSCFFLLTQEWVCPLALINLMREGEEFSNLTVEIRLDGWLRFGVSSLTLTLIIKLSFNLHLTN